MNQQSWAVILAGGDGVRLRPLTRMMTGEDRPKQFCRLYGGKTLLARTRSRLADAISPDCTVFAVVKAHERYYASELADVHPSRIVVQPRNRGTTAAIIHCLHRISGIAGDPVVGFFPTDHHYAREGVFLDGVCRTLAVAGMRRSSIILLGARAEHPEADYGWIELGAPLGLAVDSLRRVCRFWEKPSPQLAQALFAGGCLWNTFVMIGRVSAFLEILKASVPHLLDGIAAEEASDAALVQADFSRHVLSTSTARLAVYQLGDVGWSDLGTPDRLQKTLARYGLELHGEAAAGAAGTLEAPPRLAAAQRLQAR